MQVLPADERAEHLDAADPLARFHGRFVVDDHDLVYLDGNSLGRPSIDAIEAIERAARREWGDELVRGWEHWLGLTERIGDRLAAEFLGACPGEVVVADSTSVNFYRLAAAALDARPDRRTIVTDRGNFPTDRYVLEGLAARHDLDIRWVTGDPVEGIAPASIAAAIDRNVALVALCLVDYRSAAIAELAQITALAHAAGALVLWDLSHAVGAIPIELETTGVDLAVGCTYKYLNGGPGAPAFLYVRRSLQEALRNPVQGWFGQSDQFAMGPRYEPAEGIRRWLVGTPPILALAAVEAAVELAAEAGIGAIRAKSVALSSFAVELYDEWLAPRGFALGSPRDPARRGGHVALRRADGRALAAALGRNGVIVDFREPDVVRLGLSPLTTSFADVHAGLAHLRRICGGAP